MSWEEGNQKYKKRENVNERLLKVEEFKDSDEAKIAFCEFLEHNLYYFTKFLTGVELYEFQEIILRGMFNRDYFLNVVSRGGGKSFLIGIFIALYCVMNPGSKVVILSLSFRQSRQILQELEKLAKTQKALFLRKCIVKTTRGTDMWNMEFTNGAQAIALPLASGDKIRGVRAQVVVCDEFLSFEEKMVNEVIKPFLSTNKDTKKKTDIYALETKLIEQGKMKEEDRTVFEKNKFIALSSASFKFQHMYKVYCDYLENIDKGDGSATYGVSQLSYQVMPKGFFDSSFIEDSRKAMSVAQFNRELGAQFSDDSSGYFKMSSLINCSVPFGEAPYFEVVGDDDAKYILAIDPSFGESETSDHFAMSLLKIDEERQTGMLVHSYALAGGTYSNHFAYFTYLLKNFNIVYVIADATQGGNDFLRGYQESKIYEEEGIKIDLFDANFKEDDWERNVRESKKSYSISAGKIYHSQPFQGWVMKANLELQKNIDHKKILFSGTPSNDDFDKMWKKCEEIDVSGLVFMNGKSVVDSEGGSSSVDFVERQADLIELTKKECAMIEVSISPGGGQTFDLPAHLRRDKSPTRARKDNYSSLLLANWAMKCYFAMQAAPKEDHFSFTPEAID